MSVQAAVQATANQRVGIGTGSLRPLAARWSRQVVVLAVPVLAAGWAWSHQDLLMRGVRQLAAGDPEWLTVAVAAAMARWPAGGLNLQGAVRERLPVRRLLAAQFAGSFTNQVLPLGLGANGVDVRFLYRCGLPLPRAVTAVAISVAVGTVTNALVVAVFLVTVGSRLVPRLPAPAEVTAGLATGLGVIGAAGAAACAVVACRGCSLRRTARFTGVRSAVADLGALMRCPSRAVMLWSGAALQKCLPALVLLAVLRAMNVAVPAVILLGAYFVASSVAGWVPVPGGFGAVEISLAVTLGYVGVPAASAVAGVLGYRLLTSWLPVLPAGAVFVYLVRRNVL